MRGHLLASLLAVSCVLVAPRAGAAPDKIQEARAYFETGSKEFDKGNFMNAVRAFETAYELSQRPGLLFSIAQSYRSQYTLDSKVAHLRKAAEYYRLYIAKDQTGKRKKDAALALADVEVLLARASASADAAGEPAAPEATVLSTQISITSNVAEATISIDGAAPRPLEPVDVKPGEHKVVIAAEGYFPEERNVKVGEGRLQAFDVPLREKPAEIAVTSRSGAEVFVDGALRGTTPLVAPLKLDAGARFIAVTLPGYTSFSEELDIQRGEKRELVVKLERTRQRVASYVFFGAGLVSAGFGVVAALGAAGAEAQARRIDDKRQSSFITGQERADYNAAVSARNDLRVGTGILFAGAAAIAGTGALLFLFDQSPVVTPSRKTETRSPAPAPAPKPGSGIIDASIAPIVGPGLYGATLQGRF